SEHDRVDAASVKEYLREKTTAGCDTITFTVPPRVHIPWGLLYDEVLASDGYFVNKDNFWCIKYNVSTYYDSLRMLGIDKEWQAEDFPLLFGAHEIVWNAAYPMLSADEQGHLERLLRPPEQPIFSRSALRDLWHQPDRAPYGFLIFY